MVAIVLRICGTQAEECKGLGEQSADVVGGEGGAESVTVVDNTGEQLGFAGVEGHHLVLDGVVGNEAVHRHVAGLADAVCALDGLGLGDR